MKKIVLLVVTVSFASACFASWCCRCSTTAPLRKVGDRYYCKKHYCVKHKLINDDGKCQMCEQESLLKRGKGECLCCKSTKDLTIVKYSWNRWGLFCENHYCETHKQAPFRIGPGEWNCPVCTNESNAKKREQERLAREKAWTDAKVAYEKRKAEIAAQEEQNFRDVCALKSKPLAGLFGVNLGARTAEIKSVVGNGTYRVFSPQKIFRQFSRYYVAVEEGKIRSIFASHEFDDWDDAESEVWEVVCLLDQKFGSERRGKVWKESRTMDVRYDFGCDIETGKNPKQSIYVTVRKSKQLVGGYVVLIRAEDSVVNGKLREAKDAADIDAL